MNNELQDPVISSFLEELKREIPEKLKRVTLFGSRARKDNHKYSDYDFMVLLTEKEESILEIIYDAGYAILDKYNVLASCLIWDEEDYEFHKSLPIGKNIEREGMVLL